MSDSESSSASSSSFEEEEEDQEEQEEVYFRVSFSELQVHAGERTKKVICPTYHRQ